MISTIDSLITGTYRVLKYLVECSAQKNSNDSIIPVERRIKALLTWYKLNFTTLVRNWLFFNEHRSPPKAIFRWK